MAEGPPLDEDGVLPKSGPAPDFRWMDEMDAPEDASRPPREPRAPMPPLVVERSASNGGVWWVLLLLPIGLGGGWLAGHMPAKKSKPVVVRTAPADATVPVVAPEVDAYVISPAPAFTPEPPRETRPAKLSEWTTISAAGEESRRTGKPILLDFNADWCPPCRAMKREVFENGTLGDDVRRAVVPVSVVDRSRENGNNSPEIEELMQNYSIEAFPTLVVFMPGTGRSLQKRGYGDAEATARWIENAANSVR